MKKVALLTMDNLENFVCYDKLLIQPLSQLGWLAEEISWRKENIDWNSFDAVIVRSTWDYQLEPAKFLIVLEQINNSNTHLENNINLLKWNMNKTYLFDLKKKGVKIVDTFWEKEFTERKIAEYFKNFKTNEIIIKPVISANADNTFRLKKDDSISDIFEAKKEFDKNGFMVQPFMNNIISEGEYSLFYFGGQYSHSILKAPAFNDFRVQEEHGGILKRIEPAQHIKLTAERILNSLDVLPLYARVDLVRNNENKFSLMELELIEPSLYFNMDINAAGRFAKIFDDWMKKFL